MKKSDNQLSMLIPAASATIERAHLALKLVKTDLRSTMAEGALNALMLLYIQKDIPLDSENIITAFAIGNSRKMLLINPIICHIQKWLPGSVL